mgnify:CR=1 FL=1
MRLSSIRTRVALLSTAFAVLLVGSVTLASYLFVSDSMRTTAETAAGRLVDSASRVFASLSAQAEIEATREGLEGAEAEAYVRDELLANYPNVLSQGLVVEGTFALRIDFGDGAGPVVVWQGGDETRRVPDEFRDRALAGEGEQRVHVGGQPVLLGLVVQADFGRYVAYIPLDVPGTEAAVLDVVYSPDREEAVLDRMRAPMIIVTALALGVSLALTAMMTGWTLTLIENIRTAAESIDVGQLDVHLPEEGDNEIAELARSLNRLIDNLKRRNEAQTRFIADASHELATPVAGIRGYVNILRAWGAEDPGLREEAVGAIDRESRRMARLCSDLLSVIRSEEMVEYRSIRYDINGVAREVLANAATRYMSKRLEFRGPDEGPLWLYGDPDRIEEALGILVDNACKYTPDGGSVSVTTRRRRERVVVRVADTGIGIPAEDLPSVFERFYRSDASRSKETGGFGLGLAIAKHIIDKSDGLVTVESTLGEGTVFEVSLPRRKAGA